MVEFTMVEVTMVMVILIEVTKKDIKKIKKKIKMAIILPSGQWYAPSAVINDAWYCMVLHDIAWYCEVLDCIE